MDKNNAAPHASVSGENRHAVGSLVGFWADKPSWCWFIVKEKYCTMTDKLWLKPISEQTVGLTAMA